MSLSPFSLRSTPVLSGLIAAFSATGVPVQKRLQVLDPVILRMAAAAGGKTLRFDCDPLTTPYASTTVSAEVVHAQGAENIEEAVAYAPGVIAEPYRMDERYDTFAIRGFKLQSNGSDIGAGAL